MAIHIFKAGCRSRKSLKRQPAASIQKSRLPGKGPTAIITDLCIMRPDPETRELMVTELHPGITADQVREKTGWDIRFANDVRETGEPTDHELSVLRALLKRTADAHGTAK